MPDAPRVRAAQYLRMSTESQRYSLENQDQAISAYAVARGYEVDRTYFDPGRSGLTIRERKGLQALLTAALQPDREFDAILVLDVSRWGRFQDLDQSAHYEFLCRQAGLQVVYCAEAFENDGSATASMVKQIKRLMAAEYSRELSVKISRGKINSARRGFFTGGPAPYGFRRMVVDPSGRARLLLNPGDRKCLVSDRVVLVPGPKEERAVIKRIFHRYVVLRKTLKRIASELNKEGVPATTDAGWTGIRVKRVLSNEIAIGNYVINHTSSPLGTRAETVPPEQWVRVKVLPRVVSDEMFRRAALRLEMHDRTRLRQEEILAALRRLLKRHGHLNGANIGASRDTPSVRTYRAHFGTLTNAYAKIGYRVRTWGSSKNGDDRERVLALLRAAHERHGYLTIHIVNSDRDLPSVTLLQRWFGTLSTAYELAELPHKPSDLRSRAFARRVARGGVVGRPRMPSDEVVLQGLRRLYARDGYVCARTIDADPELPKHTVCEYRFGGLIRAYELAGLPCDAATVFKFAGVRRQACGRRAALGSA